jgi:hypothetical protein
VERVTGIEPAWPAWKAGPCRPVCNVGVAVVGGVLVEERGGGGGVPEPAHQLLGGGARRCGQGWRRCGGARAAGSPAGRWRRRRGGRSSSSCCGRGSRRNRWRTGERPETRGTCFSRCSSSRSAMAAGRVTVRCPASVLGSPTTHRPPTRRTERSTRSRPPGRTSDRLSAVASPNRSPPKARTSSSARYRVVLLSRPSCSASCSASTAVSARDGRVAFGVPAPRNRQGLEAMASSATATLRMARRSRYDWAKAVGPVARPALACQERTAAGVTSSTGTCAHGWARWWRHRPAYRTRVLFRR